jgi:RNA polymerase sigma-70 factor, ECF subfamily
LLDHSLTACAPLSSDRVAESPPLEADNFALLYQQHLPAVYRYLSSRVASPEEAEDLTAEVFRAAWTGRRGYHGRGSFRAWLFSIVRRTLADHYRHHQPASALEPEDAERLSDSAPSPEDEAVRQEQTQRARRLLASLSAAQQEVLSLRFAAELSYAEIAIVIGKREEAVKKIAQRALEAIRGRHLHAQAF